MHTNRHSKYNLPIDDLVQTYLSKPSLHIPPPLPVSTDQILHYNNLIAQNRQLLQDNQILLIKLEKYEKLQPYINTLITKNAQLENSLEKLNSQNMYLTKSMRQLHVQGKNIETKHEGRIKQLQDTIQQGKENGNRVRMENQALTNKIKTHLSQIEQYKHKLEQALTDKMQHQHQTRQTKSERDKLLGQLKQLQTYNKEIVRNAKIKQDQLMQKLQNKQKNINQLQKQIKDLLYKIEALEQDIVKKQLRILQMEESFSILSRNHQNMLDDYRGLSLRKVELEELYEECVEKVVRREEQLRQLQMFRQDQRTTHSKQLQKLQQAFQSQKQQFHQAIQHKILKNNNLTQAYNELLQRLDILQKQHWQTDQQLQIKCSQLKHKEYECQQQQNQIHKLCIEIQAKCSKQQSLIQGIYFKQEEIEKLHCALQMVERKYYQREFQFEEYVGNMRGKYEEERGKWEQLYAEEKVKLKTTHQYEKREIQTLCHKKVLILQAEIQDYRNRLARAQNHKIEKTEKEIGSGRAIISENTWLNRNLGQKEKERQRQRQRSRQWQKQRRVQASKQKQKQSHRNLSELNGSGSKTGRQTGYK